ncbi:MAG: hypothetical protein JWO91_707 [Acidobacteriaceae bacterium]|nr:hypothetical protein [Acidobacteriaceae bacterium]
MCTLLFALQLFGSDLTKINPKELLARTPKIVDIQSAGSSPFLLLAHVHLQQDTKSVDGLYAVAWAAPYRFRRVMKFPNFTETEVIVGNKIYRKRSTRAVPFLVWQFDTMMQFFHRMRLDNPAIKRFDDPNTKIRKVESEQINGAADVCISIELGRYGIGKLCVDSSTYAPAMLETGYDLRSLSAALEHYEFSDYQPFQGKLFPRKFSFRSTNSQDIEVQVGKLIATQSFDENEFTPPMDSETLPFCEAPDSKGELRPSLGNVIPMFGFEDLAIAMYFQVSEQGGVQNADVVYSNNPLKNREILKSFVGTHFPIQSCVGVPIPYETVIQVVSGH